MELQNYGYFDSEITGYDEEGFPVLDRAVNSEILALFFSKLVSNGVLAKPANCFQVEAYERMTLNINPGFLIINGHFGYNTATVQLTVDAAPTQYSRITSVVARLNNADRLIELILKNGDPAANPVAPELLQPTSGDYYEICLAEITVTSNQTVITNSSISDTRADSSKCGFITQLIDSIDTSVFYQQLNAFYEEFVAQSEESYETFNRNMDAFLSQLKVDGLTDMQDIVETLQNFETKSEGDFTAWFNNVKNQLSEDVAGHLQNEVDVLTQQAFKNLFGLDYQETEFMPDGSIVQKNSQAEVVTSFSTDESGNKVITQTITPADDSTVYKKTTTIYPATDSENKKIKEVYVSE